MIMNDLIKKMDEKNSEKFGLFDTFTIIQRFKNGSEKYVIDCENFFKMK